MIMSLGSRTHQLLLVVVTYLGRKVIAGFAKKQQNLLHASVAEPLGLCHLFDMFGDARFLLGIAEIIFPSNVFHFDGFGHVGAEEGQGLGGGGLDSWKTDLCGR